MAEPILDTTSLSVVNTESIVDVKELFSRHEQRYYVARQFNQGSGIWSKLPSDIFNKINCNLDQKFMKSTLEIYSNKEKFYNFI